MHHYFEINVSLNRSHFFATAPRSLPDAEKARRLFWLIKEAFSPEDGFLVTLSEHKCEGRIVEDSE